MLPAIPRLNTARRFIRIIDEDASTIRKRGTDFGIEREVQAMTFVQEHTTIPVPEILDFQVSKDDSWIRMRRISGTPLNLAWPEMDGDAQTRTANELRSYFTQLRNLTPPEPGWIGSLSKGPAYDHRLNNGFVCGPFTSVREFHDFLVAPVKDCPRPERAEKYRVSLSDNCLIHFAHADMSYEHILLDQKTGKVTGIIDWEMAGFWPEWWEYRKALFGGRLQRWWFDVVNRIMPSYEMEFEADCDLEMY